VNISVTVLAIHGLAIGIGGVVWSANVPSVAIDIWSVHRRCVAIVIDAIADRLGGARVDRRVRVIAIGTAAL